MLTTILIFIPATLLTLIFGVFPAGSMLVGITSAISYSLTAIWSLNSFIPVDVLFNAVFIVITVEILILTFKGTRVIISHIPWFGGRGV